MFRTVNTASSDARRSNRASGLSQETGALNIDSWSGSQSLFGEIEGIADQQLIGDDTKSITIEKIKEWHDHVTVEKSLTEQVDR